MFLLKWARALSIRTKLNVLILLFLCLPFIACGAIWYENTKEKIETNAVNSSRLLITQINNQLDSYFTDLERITFPVITHPKILKFLQLPADEQFERFLITRDIEKEVLPNFMFGRPDMKGFSIVTENGIASYGGVSSKDEYMKLFRQFENVSFRIAGIRKTDSTPVLTVVRNFRDAANYQTPGMLVIDLNLNQISSILEKVSLGQTGYVWIADNNSQILYHPDRNNEGKPVDAELMNEFKDKQEGYFLKDTAAGRTLVIFHRSTTTNWTMVSEVPLSELIGSLIELRNMTLWIAFFLILFVLAALAGFSFNLTRSLAVLQRLMKNAENGNLGIQAPEHREDEIGSLYRSFNKMVREIRSLIEVVHTAKLKEKELQLKQRDAMMQAMQSQINPHFLYNTLEAINSYAIVEDVLPISNMATSLADFFRYSVGSSQQAVRLKEELDHVQTYLAIQKERFPHLSYECGVAADTAQHVQAVRLIVQPLIENSIIHGYERHKLRPTYIGLSMELTDNCCLLRIIDHGKGMDPKLFETYNLIFEGTYTEEDTELSFNHLGLLNVHHRIRLMYGEPYGLYIEKSDTTGTVLQVRLPFNKEV